MVVVVVVEGGADILRLSGEGLDALGYAKRAGEEGAGEVHGGVSAGKDNRPVKYTDNKQPQKFILNLGLFNSFLSYEKKYATKNLFGQLCRTIMKKTC